MKILNEETKNKFGYSPDNLRPSSEKIVICKCTNCDKTLERKYRQALRNNLCLKCSNTLNANTSLYQRSLSMKGWHTKNKHPRLGKISHGKKGTYNGIHMRSSWEIIVAQYLDSQGLTWNYEPQAFPITISNKSFTYTPDFYIKEWDCYLEVKGYWRDNAKEKFSQFEREYPQINIKIWNKEKMKELGLLQKILQH